MNAQEHRSTPYLAFPRKNHKEKSLHNPNNWFVHPLTSKSYLKNLSSMPTYNKLIKHSKVLTEVIYPKNQVNPLLLVSP
jgi:hypothetical protein